VDLKTITITWMDGVTETYPHVTTIVRDGVLHVHQYTSVTNTLAAEWHFPITNIRVWAPADSNGHAYDNRPVNIITGSGQRGEPRQFALREALDRHQAAKAEAAYEAKAERDDRDGLIYGQQDA
jgi:hypothetical protein